MVGLPRWCQLVVRNLPASAGDTRDTTLIFGLGRSPAVGNGTLLQYSCLENSMGRGAWRATVHGVEKSQRQLSTQHKGCVKCLFSILLNILISQKLPCFLLSSSFPCVALSQPSSTPNDISLQSILFSFKINSMLLLYILINHPPFWLLSVALIILYCKSHICLNPQAMTSFGGEFHVNLSLFSIQHNEQHIANAWQIFVEQMYSFLSVSSASVHFIQR